MSVASTFNLADVEEIWRELEEQGIVSLTQSLDFTKSWLEAFDVPKEDQLYLIGRHGGEVVALFPLVRRPRYGVKIWTWMPGKHVGCNMPLLNLKVLDRMSDQQIETLWRRMFVLAQGADAVVLYSMPQFEGRDYFADLGESFEWESVYRTAYPSWDDCYKGQLSRTRRKHLRQQGAKLAAMGEVTFEVLDCDSDRKKVDEAVQTMFAQKADRFAQWGVEDPFADPEVQKFYRDLQEQRGSLTGQLHVLRLDGKIVAVRYHLAHQNHIFALISSMDMREEIGPGSPGKQNILRSMEHIFTSEFEFCDQGTGFSEEKRHWCNQKIPVRAYYKPLTPKGKMAVKGHMLKGRIQREIKNNPQLFNVARQVAGVLSGGRAGANRS